jgi:hypothetical protein
VSEHIYSHAELEALAASAAEKAVSSVLTSLGIDTKDPLKAQRDFAALREVRHLVDDDEFQKDLAHLRSWRKATEDVRAKTLMAVVGLLITGAAAAFWIGLKAQILGLK